MHAPLKSIVLAVIATLVLTAAGDSAQPNAVKTFMEAKLEHAQKVLQGLALEDYDLVAKHAQEMSLLSQAASWQVLQTAEYRQQSSEFRRTADAVRDAAKEKNLDEDVAYVSPSTVYRTLRESDLVCPHRGRTKRYREEIEKATRPDERWGTDLMQVKVNGVDYFYLGFIDEYSRYIVHWELLTGMDWLSVSVAAEAALAKLPRSEQGELLVKPEIRSDNGSCYISREFHGLLEHHELTHVKIKPYCPEENGIMERSNRTVREAFEESELESDPSANRYAAEAALGQIIAWYNLVSDYAYVLCA